MSQRHPAPSRKGRLRFGEFETWYRVTGEIGSGPPLVVLHGGPGNTHDYLLNLTRLSEGGRPVIHFDQLGSGGSTWLPDRGPGFWTVGLFLEQLESLLLGLGIADDYALFGHSWGGLLATEHAYHRPEGLRGLVIANAPASYPLWLREMHRLRGLLPPGVNETLLRHEAAGTTDSAEYQAAMMPFYERHVCRVKPWPRDLVASTMELSENSTVYSIMNGPSEFHVIGTLRDWGVIERCPRVAAPTLVLSGRHDEATPEAVSPFVELIPGARWELFEESSHMPHLEEPDLFFEVMEKFLREVGG